MASNHATFFFFSSLLIPKKIVVNSTGTILHPKQLRDFCCRVQPRVQQSRRGVWSWARCRHGRGTSLGQECHLVAINSYYVIKSTSLFPSSWHFPSVSVILRKHKSSCIFCIAKFIPFWVPKAVHSASAAPLGCGALCWHWNRICGDCVWATSRSRADLCRLCFAAVSVSFILFLLHLAQSGTDVMLSETYFSLSWQRSAAVASLRMWELQLLEGEMIWYCCLHDVKQDGVCMCDTYIVSQNSGNRKWIDHEMLEVGTPS